MLRILRIYGQHFAPWRVPEIDSHVCHLGSRVLLDKERSFVAINFQRFRKAREPGGNECLPPRGTGHLSDVQLQPASAVYLFPIPVLTPSRENLFTDDDGSFKLFLLFGTWHQKISFLAAVWPWPDQNCVQPGG